MALVDYTSSDSESGSAAEDTVAGDTHTTTAAAVKRRKLSHSKSKTACAVHDCHTEHVGANSRKPERSLPPLPPAFHDLYASTVRVSTSDDPTLHQGRKRVNPHKAGNWPSHLYIEWHPTPSQRTRLTALLSDLQTAITTTPSSPPITLTSFLTSDLSAPQPLHISLSRPIVLTTPQKDPFLSDLSARIARGSPPAHAFDLVPRALEWHRGPESERTFLVLRVASASASASTSAANPNPNPELSLLLRRCNDLVAAYGQPALYSGAGTSGDDDDRGGRFHVSLAWTFGPPTPELVRAAAGVAGPFFASRGRAGADVDVDVDVDVEGNGEGIGEGARMRIRVDGVKAKIGNVVTCVELPAAGGRGGRRRRSGGGGEDEGVRSGILGV